MEIWRCEDAPTINQKSRCYTIVAAFLYYTASLSIVVNDDLIGSQFAPGETIVSKVYACYKLASCLATSYAYAKLAI
ncbi:hypothetical protein WG947_04260 [Pontibacter sp. H259]|uniref:hypothetical protein n=1 Tax=Pontibacter sp. H259 TaxID=3133421 RepID=UPI0030C24292